MATAVHPYPGHDSSGGFTTPRQACRVRPEGEEYAKRNMGTTNLLGEVKNPVETPRPEPRCGDAAARANYEKGRNGSTGALLGGQASTQFDSQPAVRVRPEAEGIAEAHKGSATSNLLTNYGNFPPSARGVPRVTAQGESTAVMHSGNRMSSLMHEPSKLPQSARPASRVKGEGEGNADLGKGRQMMKVFGSYGQPLTTRPAPRVLPAGEDSAELDKGKRMDSLLCNSFQKKSPSPRPQVKVRGDGQDNARLDLGARISRLIHEGDKLPRSPRVPVRVSYGGKLIAQQSQGSIAQIFHDMGKKQIVPQPGRRE